MIYFVLDACALARIYFPDIGTRNLLQIYDYPDSKILIPHLAYSETISVLISALNQHFIDDDQYRLAKARLSSDLLSRKILSVEVTDVHISASGRLLEKHKRQPGRMKLGGADALYLALALQLASSLQHFGGRVILVTSDGALYSAALDEPDIEAFHFWTCDLGCQCGTVWTPIKGAPQPPKPSNTCSTCGATCDICCEERCPSKYRVSF
jgi:predicted nucleic acid-binding protein